MEWAKRIIIAILIFLIGIGIGKYLTPEKTIIKEKVVYVEKKQIEEKRNVKKVITKNKDGTIVTTIEDKTEVREVANKESESKKEEVKRGAVAKTGLMFMVPLNKPIERKGTYVVIDRQLVLNFTGSFWAKGDFSEVGVGLGFRF